MERESNALVRGLVFVTIAVAVTGCSSTVTIHPKYASVSPAVTQQNSGTVALRIIDHIDNTAPLAHQIKGLEHLRPSNMGLLGSHTLDNGQLFLSPKGPYKLDADPEIVVRRIFTAALLENGVQVADGAPNILEVEMLRMEFALASKPGDSHVKLSANILFRPALRREARTEAETAVLRQEEKEFGFLMTNGAFERYVSEVLSRAVDQTLNDPRFAESFVKTSVSTR
jgi:hypothetical protein